MALHKKKDWTWCMSINYREQNKIIIKDKFPMLVVLKLLDELYGAMYFSKLNFRFSYHQIRMKNEDIHKRAF